jgi:hypothetical protein
LTLNGLHDVKSQKMVLLKYLCFYLITCQQPRLYEYNIEWLDHNETRVGKDLEGNGQSLMLG